jgi:hypothetical protein
MDPRAPLRRHGDQRTRLGCRLVDDDVRRYTIFHRAGYVNIGESCGDPFQVSRAALHRAVHDRSDQVSFFRREMQARLNDVDDSQEFSRDFQFRRQRARVGQDFFSRFGAIQWHQYSRVHAIPPVQTSASLKSI